MTLNNNLLNLLVITPGLVWIASCSFWAWPGFFLTTLDRQNYAAIGAGFAFTQMGFLTAILSAMLAISGSAAFRIYQLDNKLEEFMGVFRLSKYVLVLMLASSVALLAFDSKWLLYFNSVMFVIAVSQFFWITTIITNIGYRQLIEVSASAFQASKKNEQENN